MNYDWNELAFANKKPLNDQNATLLIAPREISQARFIQLVKQYLPKGNLLVGLAKEKYIDGFAGQPQFRTLKLSDISQTIDKINHASSKSRIYTLEYFQRDLPFIIEKLDLTRVIAINGSWQRSFHLRPEYYEIAKKRLKLELLPAFTDELEARSFAAKLDKINSIKLELPTKLVTTKAALEFAKQAAHCSFDYTGQVGAVLARKSGAKYELLATSFNRVLPFQTFSMLNGSLREQHYSAAGDLNYYDSVHAEASLVAKAAREKIDLGAATLFVTVSPCPNCSFLLANSGISEVIYASQHSTSESNRILGGAKIKLRELAK